MVSIGTNALLRAYRPVPFTKFHCYYNPREQSPGVKQKRTGETALDDFNFHTSDATIIDHCRTTRRV